MHTICHLRNGQVRSIVQNPGPTHEDNLKNCKVQMAYLSMGQFVELVKWDKPLEIVLDMDKTRSTVIGELSSLPPEPNKKDDPNIKSSEINEDKATTAPGRDTENPPKEPIPGTSCKDDDASPVHQDDPTPSTSVEKVNKGVELKTPKLQVYKLQMGKDQLMYINEKALEKYPLSRYREGNYYQFRRLRPAPTEK